MAGLLSGLAGLGLDELENMNIYEEPKKGGDTKAAASAPKVEEKDLIYDKSFSCPVCGAVFISKVMKTGKAKMLGTDQDLRPKYEGIDVNKYDVELCTECGYAALTRFFPNVSSGQAKLIRENISKKVRLRSYDGEIYTYEEAVERYKLALANAVVKHSKSSEKAYICLKSAWVLRGYREFLQESGDTVNGELQALANEEEEYLQNAYEGFMEARQSESFPMCGMDEMTIDYLLAALAIRFKKYDVAGRLTAAILTSPAANTRTKDKARELKDQILAEVKRK